MANDKTYSPSTAASVLAAALLLPGVQAQAASAPENGSITLGYLDYRDSQSGLDRITVHAPSVSVLAPLAGVWAIGGTLVSDDVSGASPRYHSAVSGASRMSDHRTAADLAVTRYFERGSLQAGVSYSNERDYLSRALSLQGTLDSEDKNTSWTVGLGYADDHINPVNNVVTGERRRTPSVLLGMTQVLGVNDIAQLTATYSQGDGYFSDPYKALDNRPRSRDQSTLLARWNHHLANGWTVTPELRLYTQSAASFYYDPVYDAVLGAPFPPGYQANPDGFRSADQRLSGFGAVTAALKVSKQLGKLWTVDAKAEYYQQRGSWRAFDDGSPGLAPLRARTLQIAVTRQW